MEALTAASARFPDGFLWGAATSSYQIEGATEADGRGDANWDLFCRTPGKILNGDTGAVACDHYHRYRDDVRLMAELGLKAYRFSVAWPRVLPRGTGRPNEKGLDFYDRLVDELLGRGIRPFLTLYHWDHPQVLDEKGGWLNRDFADWFADYAGVVARRLADRVSDWLTLNEPPCIVGLGFQQGLHSPGRQETPKAVNQVTHHVLLAHGLGVRVLRSEAGSGCRVGLAFNPATKIPFSASPEDLAASRRAWRDANGWWLDPIFKGAYPAAAWRGKGADVPDVRDGDMAAIASPLDFLGLNIYFGERVRALPARGAAYEEVPYPPAYPRTAMDWPVTPEAAYFGLKFPAEEYGLKTVYMTENGCAFDDAVSPGGEVRDPRRVRYYEEHLAACRRAMDDGVPLRGYFAWSLMDNFEWSLGYAKRFGLCYVDYPTQKRTLKDSARWYRSVIERNAL